MNAKVEFKLWTFKKHAGRITIIYETFIFCYHKQNDIGYDITK